MLPITEFTDHRQVIRAWMEDRPQTRTQGLLARRTGFGSALVSMVLGGTRKLPIANAETWARAMNLQGDDLAYFVALVRLANGTDAERREAWTEVRSRREFALARRLPLDSDALGRWYTWVVLEMAKFPDFRGDPAWLAERLSPPITPEEARATLEALHGAGMLAPDAEGVLRPTGAPVVVADEPDASARLIAMHRQHLTHALSALDHPERHVVSVVVALPASEVADLAGRLEQAVREVLSGLPEDGVPDRVVQLSFQIVPRAHQG